MKHQFITLALTLFTLTGCATIPLMGPTPTSIPSETPPAQGLRLHKYPGNYTSFKIQSSSGVTIITDPFQMDEMVQPDIVTFSHSHLDHTDLSHISGKYNLIRTVGTFVDKGVTITGVAGHHNRGDVGTTNIIYIFDIDGIRLAQFASQGDVLNEEMYAKIGHADILIIQVYWVEHGKLSAQEVAKIARRLQAHIVIPAHTDTTKTDLLASLMGVKIERIPSGEMTVTQADMAKQSNTRLVVLDVDE